MPVGADGNLTEKIQVWDTQKITVFPVANGAILEKDAASHMKSGNKLVT
jgi:hypothetical protein